MSNLELEGASKKDLKSVIEKLKDGKSALSNSPGELRNQEHQPLLMSDHEMSGGITHMEESHKLNALSNKTPDASLRQSIGAIYEKSRTYWDSTVRKADATEYEKKSLETLKTLAYIKLGEEIMKQDVLAQHLGFSTTDTQLTKIRDGALYAFEQEGQLHITCNQADIGNNKILSLNDAVNKIERKKFTKNRDDKQIMDDIKWHLPKVYAIKLEMPSGEDTKVLITDDEKLFNDSKNCIKFGLAATTSRVLITHQKDGKEEKKEFFAADLKQKLKDGQIKGSQLISGGKSGVDLSDALQKPFATDNHVASPMRQTLEMQQSQWKEVKCHNKSLLNHPITELAFSDDRSKRELVEQKAIIDGYLFRIKYPSEIHLMQKFEDIYVKGIKDSKRCMKFLSSQEKIASSIRSLRQIGADIAKVIKQEDPEKLTIYITQECNDARDYLRFSENFLQQFDAKEHWVQEGMKKLGVSWDNLQKYAKELRAAYPQPDSLENGSPDQKIAILKNLMLAKAKLRYFNDKINAGIPVEKIPDSINGRKLVDTSGSGFNCLIHSLLKVNHPDWDNNKIEQEAKPIRNAVEAFKISPEYQLRFEPQSKPVIPGGFLNLGDGQGQKVLELMQEKHQFDSSRGLLIYHYHNERINCIERIARSSEKGPDAPPPYAIFLQGQSHFSAMLDPKDVSPSVSQTDRGDAPAKPQLEALLSFQAKDITPEDQPMGYDMSAWLKKPQDTIKEIAQKEQELLKNGVSLKEIYKDVENNYRNKLNAVKGDMGNYSRLTDFLGKINRLLDEKIQNSGK